MVECHCILPQFRTHPNPPFHKFIVFSMIDDGDTVIKKHAKCNNCGVMHDVFDIGKSQVLAGQEAGAVLEIKDIELMMPSSLSDILKSYNCDLPIWEHVLFILQNDLWGTDVILTRDSEGDSISGKVLKFVTNGNYQIYPYSMKEML